MKKWMFAALWVVCMFAIATGAGENAPAAAPNPPGIGGCRWFCPGNPTRFTSAASCAAACSTECDVVC